MKLDLSERQRQTIAAAVTILATFVILCAVAALLYLIGSFFARFSNVFLPVGVAAVMALVVRPYWEWLLGRRLPKTLALAIVFASVLLPVVTFGLFFGDMIVTQSRSLVEAAPGVWERVVDFAEDRTPQVVRFFEEREIGQRIRTAVEEQANSILRGVRSGLQTGLDAAWTGVRRILGAIGALLAWAVLPVYFAFFLMSDPRGFLDIDHMLPFLKKDTRSNVVYLLQQFVDILVAFFRGQLVIAFLQGMLFAIGFSVVGLRSGFVLGLMLGFLNIIPYLGNMVGLGIAIPLALFQREGGVVLLVWVMVVFVAVQMIEGYVLTPKIMGDRTGLHPVAIILAIFFWGSALGGITGMILAIPLTAFFVVFWRLAKERYIGELV